MGSRYEVELTITKGKDLKNINWKYGPLKPYAVVWVDPRSKSSSHVDEEGDTSPEWNETLRIPFNTPIDDEESTLHIDIIHAKAEDEDTKPLIGSATLPLRDVVDEVGLDNTIQRKLRLKRPSGRPHGTLEVSVNVHELRYPPPGRYPAPAPAPAYGYGAPYAAPPSGYPYTTQPPPPPYGQAGAYGQPGYGQAPYPGQPGIGQAPYYEGQPAYGQEVYGGYGEEKKKSGGMGMGTGLAVGAAAGLLGGLAISEGIDYLEDNIADDVADRVEDDYGYDDDE